MSSRSIIAVLSLTGAVLVASSASASVLRVSYHTNNQTLAADGTDQLVALDDANNTSVNIQPTSTQTLVFTYSAECALLSGSVGAQIYLSIWVDNHQIAPVTNDFAMCAAPVANVYIWQTSTAQAFAGLSAGKHSVQVKARATSGNTIWLGNGTLSVIQ